MQSLGHIWIDRRQWAGGRKHQAVDVAEAAELDALELIDTLAVDEPLAMDDEALAVALVTLYDASTALKSVVTF